MEAFVGLGISFLVYVLLTYVERRMAATDEQEELIVSHDPDEYIEVLKEDGSLDGVYIPVKKPKA